VWFTGPGDLPLLAKYIFTGERLSIQVHPKEKTECWYALDAEPGAMIGLGLMREISRDELRAAALDGSIEGLIDWRPVRGGDFFLVPPGMIHAIDTGLSLLEFQHNVDVTYRLYDYGRGRELHVDQAVAVAQPGPYPRQLAQHLSFGDERALVAGPPFDLILSHSDALRDRQRWIMPLEGTVRAGTDVAGAGECLLLQPADELASDSSRVLIGAMA